MSDQDGGQSAGVLDGRVAGFVTRLMAYLLGRPFGSPAVLESFRF